MGLLVGLVVAAGAALYSYFIIAAFGIAALAAAISNWRRSIAWMLAYIPFSGLLPLALYPHEAPAVLLKDFLFVGPAYLGALLLALRHKQSLSVPAIPWYPIAALSLLVVVEAANPSLLRPLVGPIGVKIWLFYLPLIALGYHLFDVKAGLQRLLKMMTALAMIPCVLGIIEALLVYGGQSSFVYRLYGAAAAATTQDFATFTFGGTGKLSRVSSIFQFTAQYWLFTTATIAIAYAAWRGNRGDRAMRWLGPTAVLVALIASMTSGERAAFIFSPFLLLVIAILEGVRVRGVLLVVAGSLLGIVATLALLHLPAGPLAALTGDHTSFILDLFRQGLGFGFHHTLLGLGSGADTNSAHYAFSTTDEGVVYALTKGVWYESWYQKALLELGFAGLVLLIVLLASLVHRSLTNHRLVRDPECRSISAAFFALFIWIIVFSVKTAYIDIDPLSTYIWVFLGIQWRVRTFDTTPVEAHATGRRPAVLASWPAQPAR